MIEISKFKDEYTNDVIDLVLHFQNDGTRPPVSVDDQPDLLHITEKYINSGGYFWIATDNGKLAGTIGIMPCNDKVAVMKKFFVYEKYQSSPHHLGRKLYSYFLDFAKKNKYKTIMLDTPYNTTRAHKFYEKAGFKKFTEDELPIKFSHPYKDCDFFILNL